jgi:hypothetical protein
MMGEGVEELRMLQRQRRPPVAATAVRQTAELLVSFMRCVRLRCRQRPPVAAGVNGAQRD